MKRLMILGAGVYQVPLIKKAREMGLETVVVSPSGRYPGIPYADIHLDLDTTDKGRIVPAAQEYGISAVVTTGTDVSVPSLGAVVDAMGLRGPSERMAKIVSSKTRFRDFLQDCQLSSPAFKKCLSIEDARDFCHSQRDKTVIKPDDSSGSRGVTVISAGASEQEIVGAYCAAKSFSRSGLVCAESFLPGVEVGGDAFLVDGQLRFFMTTCKHMEGVVVRGHSLPGNLTDKQLYAVKEELSRVLRGLAYRNGPVNFDVMVGPDKVTVLEMGLRNGGNGILDLIHCSVGIDLAEWLVANALGMDVPVKAGGSPRPISSYVFGGGRQGTLAKVSTLAQLEESVPEVFELVLAHGVGDTVEPFVHNANLIGYVLLNCGAQEYHEVTARLRSALEVEVEP